MGPFYCPYLLFSLNCGASFTGPPAQMGGSPDRWIVLLRNTTFEVGEDTLAVRMLRVLLTERWLPVET